MIPIWLPCYVRLVQDLGQYAWLKNYRSIEVFQKATTTNQVSNVPIDAVTYRSHPRKVSLS